MLVGGNKDGDERGMSAGLSNIRDARRHKEAQEATDLVIFISTVGRGISKQQNKKQNTKTAGLHDSRKTCNRLLLEINTKILDNRVLMPLCLWFAANVEPKE